MALTIKRAVAAAVLAALAATALSLTTAQSASAQSQLVFKFRTELHRGGETIVRNQNAIVNVPMPLNVDRDALPELVGTVQVLSLNKVQLHIGRVSNEPLPLSVEAIAPDPSLGALPRGEIAVGYDAIDSNAPGVWRAELLLKDVFGNPDPVRMGINMHTVKPHGPLTVIGELFDTDSAGIRVNRLRGRLRFQPIPEDVIVDLSLGSRIEATVNTTEKSTVDVLGGVSQGDEEQRLTAHIEQLPRNAHVSYDSAGEDQRRVDYDASSAIDRIDAIFTERTGSPSFQTVTQIADFKVLGVPQGLTVEQTGPTSARLDTRGGVIGTLNGAIAEGGDPIRDPDSGDYLKIVEDDAFESIAFRLLGIGDASFNGSSPITLDAILQPGPLRADIDTPELDAHAEIRDLPHEVSLLVDPDEPRVIYDGNGATMDELNVVVDTPSPLFGRVTHLDAQVDDLPSSMQLDIGQEGDGIQLGTDNPIGRLEVSATSGSGGETLAPGQQGAVVRDLDDRFGAFARVFDLRSVDVRLEPMISANLRLGGGRPFTAAATVHQPGDDLDATATIENLPSQLGFTFNDDPLSGIIMSYNASDPINRIQVEAHNLEGISRAKHVLATVTGVPTNFRFALPKTGPKVFADASAPIGSIDAKIADAGFESLAGDGLIYKDTINRFAVSAHVSGLRGLTFQEDPNISATLDIPNGTAPFSYDVEKQEFPEDVVEYFRGVVDRPQRNTSVTLKTEPEFKLDYSAGEPIGQITMTSNIGEVGLIDNLTLSNLPRKLAVCFDSGPGCPHKYPPRGDCCGEQAVSAFLDNEGSGDGPLQIDGTICIKPNSDVDCEIAPQQYVTIDNLSMRHLFFDATSEGTQSGFFIDSLNEDVSGTIEYRDSDLPVIEGARLNLPPGFQANNRRGAAFGFTYGTVNCPSGTFIGVLGAPVLGDVDLSGAVCDD